MASFNYVDFVFPSVLGQIDVNALADPQVLKQLRAELLTIRNEMTLVQITAAERAGSTAPISPEQRALFMAYSDFLSDRPDIGSEAGLPGDLYTDTLKKDQALSQAQTGLALLGTAGQCGQQITGAAITECDDAVEEFVEGKIADPNTPEDQKDLYHVLFDKITALRQQPQLAAQGRRARTVRRNAANSAELAAKAAAADGSLIEQKLTTAQLPAAVSPPAGKSKARSASFGKATGTAKSGGKAKGTGTATGKAKGQGTTHKKKAKKAPIKSIPVTAGGATTPATNKETP